MNGTRTGAGTWLLLIAGLSAARAAALSAPASGEAPPAQGTTPAVVGQAPPGGDLIPPSEDFAPPIWMDYSSSVHPKVTTTWDGVKVGTKISGGSGGGNHAVVYSTAAKPAVAEEYTMTVECKAAEFAWCSLQLYDHVGGGMSWFHLTGAGSTGSPWGQVRSSITPLGSGWYRCRITVMSGATTNPWEVWLRPEPADGPSYDYVGDGTSGVFMARASLWKKPSAAVVAKAPPSLPASTPETAVPVTLPVEHPKATPIPPPFPSAQNSLTVAVAQFEAQNVSAGDSAVISDLFRSEIIQQGSFVVVEKNEMEKVLREQAFQQTGCTSQECAVKLGRILNVRYLVVGSFGKLLDRYVLNIRVVEVESARAVYSDHEQGKDVAEVQAGITRLATRLSNYVTGKK